MDASQTQLFDRWSLPIMILDRDLRFAYFNQAYQDTTNMAAEDLMGQYIFDVFPETEARVEKVKARFLEVFEGKVTQLDAQPFHLVAEDGTSEELIWQATQDPIYDADGNVTHMIQRASDITERYDLSRRNHAMMIEINHRIKNMMAIVVAIARISGRNAKDVKSFVNDFADRVGAMGRTHDRLARDSWRGVSIHKAIEFELRPYIRSKAAVEALEGPEIYLSASGAKDLSLVIHELVTNAVKYGAFSERGGTLNIDWLKTPETLEINWREDFDTPITLSDRKGFGTKLFDMLPHVNVTRDLRSDGMTMTISLSGDTTFAGTMMGKIPADVIAFETLEDLI